MNILVAGAGAVGGWVAARLALAGERVMAVTSHGPVERIEITEAGETHAAEFARLEGSPDLLILAVKAPALPAVAGSLAERIGPETLVLPMLNGVPWWFVQDEPLTCADPGGKIASAFPVERVIGCVVHASCSRAGRDRIDVKHADKLILGEAVGGRSERVDALCRMFEHAGMRCEASADVRRAIWYKLWGNATVNPLSALTRATADVLLQDPVLRPFMAEAMDELARVGAAIGCAISESAEDRMAVTARLGRFKPSMLQDVEAGRPIELEALVGAPREIAQRRRIATPALDRIYAMTRLMGEQLKLL